jgi:hypothetical protein
VTLPGFAGGEYLPLPASKGPAFPFPLTLGGYPTFPANFAQEQGLSPKIEKASERKNLKSRSELLFRIPRYINVYFAHGQPCSRKVRKLPLNFLILSRRTLIKSSFTPPVYNISWREEASLYPPVLLPFVG